MFYYQIGKNPSIRFGNRPVGEIQVQESRPYFAVRGAVVYRLCGSRPGRSTSSTNPWTSPLPRSSAASVPVHVRGHIWISVAHVDFNCEFGTCSLKTPTLVIV